MFDFTLDYKEQQFFGFQRFCLFIGLGFIVLFSLFWRVYNIPNIPTWLAPIGIAAGVMLLSQKGRFAKTGMLMGYAWLMVCFIYSLLFFSSLIEVKDIEITFFLAEIESFLYTQGFITLEDMNELGLTSLQPYIRDVFLSAHIGGLIYSALGLMLTLLRFTQKILPLLFVCFSLSLPLVCFMATFFAWV
ncbi:hypothetical protein HW260_09190 [Helicobacter cinaedi]|uniref:Uncharacterized protein n=1 Tax=Helicobacter cinaedi CCUG 18818 = ATCC BAA-847 TaxID=537971 RepID=A0AAI8MKL8_9HELI|nr:hypothetical protein [Helicobacter cinaedi]EFR47468.1 hypothetical protein HCCG_02016 [Helicobacter cinaedi CCUG 18818 = ATCC BAA-847]QOQ90399.1 hypothetical protein HW260_09190 [Helicobacter cinaedi]BAM31430.1 hypothetical protein HCBAA847_0175 [Helicobacter cinaedi CCUG 18818 = ATCC BAA-847]